MKILMSMSSTTLFFWLFLVIVMSCTINLGFCSYNEINGGMNCRESEIDALLMIKNGLNDPSHRLASWSVDNAAADCCNWYGVVCDNVTGHILELQLRSLSYQEDWETKKRSSFGGKISHSLLNLTRLTHLDLSNNVFEGIQIPKFLGSMESLRYLNLNYSGFGGHIPPQLGNLTNLLYLNLGTYYGSSSSEDVHWLSGLPSLQFLDMSGVNLNKSLNMMSVINTLPSLQELHLSSCNLPSPSLIRNLNFSSTLRVLDLSFNVFSSKSIFTWTSHLKHLKSLNLARSHFPGSNIPTELRNMSTSLTELDLSWNGFNSSIPHWLCNFTNLELLNLADNDFHGKISDTIQNMTSLVTLDLSFNYQLLGGNPSSFRNLCNLRILSLEYVNLSQNVTQLFESLSGCGSNSLESLHLGNCQLFGDWISKDLGKFKNLSFLDLSGNAISGIFPTSLVELKSLTSLDLSRNAIYASFEVLKSLTSLELSSNSISVSIPMSLGELKSLTSLDLSESSISGSIPMSLGELKSLTSLDLSQNSISGSIPMSLGGLKSLWSLDLSRNSISGSIPMSLGELKSLSSLDLSQNSIFGSIPMSLGELKSLTSLDLSRNALSGSIPMTLGVLKSLTRLDLSQNSLSGSIPMSLGELKLLTSLDLSGNSLSGSIPVSLGFLKSLTSLDLSWNSISGSIPMSFGELICLGVLSLTDNKLSGDLPTNLGNLTKLEELNIEGNSISGPVPTSLGQLRSLRAIHFSGNKLNGTLPESFGRLSNLELADMNDNLMEGDVSETHFANLSSLVHFYANGNKMNLKVGPNWIPPPRLVDLGLGSWNVGSKLPTWLPSLKNLVRLNLSNCGISTSSIPGWFWRWSSQLDTLILSHNNIQGVLPNRFTFPSVTDLSSNNFQGPLPHHAGTSLSELDLSNNSFSGSISSFLCSSENVSRSAYVINMENNILDGEIPDCWNIWGNLKVLKLGNNKFNGSIPESVGSLIWLELLHLHDNHLSGEVPFSLGNCTRLIALSMGGNRLEGNIPSWIGEKLLNLVILNLGRNSFSGTIPRKICHITSLHILDFSNNNLFGTIPSCVSNFSAMTKVNVSNHFFGGEKFNSTTDTMQILTKGQMHEYSSILGLFKSFDLSSNMLSGKIPEEITGLNELQSLNLSHNSLSGRIPKNIGSMTLIESVDFSSNQLIGEIPPSISRLTFLSLLNLSHNELVGRIPSGTQIQSLDSSCFIGNELCGKPLTDNCSSDGTVSTPSNKENGNSHDFQIKWLYVTVALGFIVGFWGVVGPLLFNRNWRLTYFRFLQSVEDKIYIWWHFM